MLLFFSKLVDFVPYLLFIVGFTSNKDATSCEAVMVLYKGFGRVILLHQVIFVFSSFFTSSRLPSLR